VGWWAKTIPSGGLGGWLPAAREADAPKSCPRRAPYQGREAKSRGSAGSRGRFEPNLLEAARVRKIGKASERDVK